MEAIYVIVGKDVVNDLPKDGIYANQIRELDRIIKHEKPIFGTGFLRSIPDGLEDRVNGNKNDVELRICGAYAHREVQVQLATLEIRGYNAKPYEPACIREF